MDFASAAPSVKSIKQRDLLNTWLRLYARQQTAPPIWEYQPARLEEELSDLIYYTVDDSTPPPRLTIVVAYERLLLPFLTDDKVSHVIASLKTFCEDGGFEIKNLLRGNDALPRPKLRTVIDRDLFHRAPGRIAAADVVEFADQSGPGVAAEIIELN